MHFIKQKTTPQLTIFFIGFLAFCQCLDSSSVVQVVVPEEIISNKYGGDCHKKI